MVHKYTQGLIIDGITYNIPMVSIQRTLDFLEKYADIPVMNYNWKAGNLSDVCEFINTGKILPKNKINHMEVRYGV